jgi:O-antigen ligase
MSSPPQATLPESSPAAVPCRTGTGSAAGSLSRILNGATYFFLCLFALLLPHSIKGSQHAWQIAFLLWLLTLVIARRRPFPQPLSAPLLAFVTLSGVSTLLSPDPILSWDRMKIVCLVLVGIVFAQNLHRLKQVRTLVYLLIASGVAAAGFTAWQYSHGVGVKVFYTTGGPPIWQAHIFPDDVIATVDGRSVHTPAELFQLLDGEPLNKMLRIEYLRGAPFHPKETFLTREDFVNSGMGTPSLQLTRARPEKAQGTLGHYVNFAVVMMQIACMAWAMLLATEARRRGLRLLLATAFAAITAAVFLTEVRAALAALAVGGFLSILMLAGRRSRLWATAALAIVVLAALLWIRHTRGPHWMGTHDAGTSFRTMMWEDAPRLMRMHPWFGLGMETIRNHWMEWHIHAYSYFHDESHFHNDLIQIAVERGLPAAAAWLWFVIAYAVFLFRLIGRARKRSRFAAGAATGILAGFIAYELTAVVHYNLGIEPVALTLYFYVGLAIALDRMLQTPEAIDVA